MYALLDTANKIADTSNQKGYLLYRNTDTCDIKPAVEDVYLNIIFKMGEPEKYICPVCGEEHIGWSALTFSVPAHYNDLATKEKENLAQIDTDFCLIRYPDQTDRFIRCTLTQKVKDHCEDLEYGLWVSLSEKNFLDYQDHFNDEHHQAQYFGWLSNRIPGYEDTTKIPTTVYTRPGGKRPEIVPHREFDHPFVRDYYNGIRKEDAERRIKERTQFKSIDRTAPK